MIFRSISIAETYFKIYGEENSYAANILEYKLSKVDIIHYVLCFNRLYLENKGSRKGCVCW